MCPLTTGQLLYLPLLDPDLILVILFPRSPFSTSTRVFFLSIASPPFKICARKATSQFRLIALIF